MDDLNKFLAGLHAAEGKKFFSREDAVLLFTALGNPQNRAESIHVAGTNGKGSVSAILAAIIDASGKSVGHTCSPHLYDVTERCLINGRPQQKEEYFVAIRHVHEVALSLGYPSQALTFFVLTLGASFFEFARLALDWIVIEAGLGGGDDATNVLGNCRAAVVTSIGYDHVELLGSTLPEIAAKKAGIARAGVPMFVGQVPQEVKATIRETALRKGTTVEFAGEEFFWSEQEKLLVTPEGAFPLDLDRLSLHGGFQKRNAILAGRTAYALGFSAEAVQEGLSAVRWPGRCEEFEIEHENRSIPVLLDVAHNEEGMRILGEEISQRSPLPPEVIVLISMLDRKDYRGALQALLGEISPLRRRWICTSSQHLHARPPEDLEDYLDSRGEKEIAVVSDPVAALATAEAFAANAAASPLIVVTGSVYLIAKIRPLLSDRPVETIVR